jgi:hypothetical protein
MKKIIAGILLLVFIAGCKSASISTATKLQHKIPTIFLGSSLDDYGIKYTITDALWTQHPGIKYHVVKYDTAGQYIIARNAESNPSDGGLYSRIDVMRFTDMAPWDWGFCLTVYKAKTIEEAIAAISADRNNPRKGCGGYPFSRMKKE